LIDSILKEAQLKIDKAIEVAKEDFATIRTGRANASMFNKISADYYGTQTPLNQMATFQTPEARMIIITPFDKGAIQAIEKAIRESDLGVNPSNDGGIIRVAIPQLTEERRKEFIKVAKNKAEDARISIRNIRRNAKDALDKSKKDGDVSQDDVKRAEKALDEITNKGVHAIDDVLKHKESELLEV
jgi:ribosome recycling factor